MDIKKLLSTTPETLALEQYDALRQAVVSRLGTLGGLVQRGAMDEAGEMLMSSPSGDGHGCDNSCIDFSDVLDRGEQGCSTDIGDVLDRLASLKKVIDRDGIADQLKRGGKK